MNSRKIADAYLWTALLIIIAAIFLMVGVYFRWFQLHFTVDLLIGSFNLHHWFSWIGTLFIALFTPVYSILKRRYTKKIKTLFESSCVWKSSCCVTCVNTLHPTDQQTSTILSRSWYRNRIVCHYGSSSAYGFL